MINNHFKMVLNIRRTRVSAGSREAAVDPAGKLPPREPELIGADRDEHDGIRLKQCLATDGQRRNPWHDVQRADEQLQCLG
jgi:hypothetical protein